MGTAYRAHFSSLFIVVCFIDQQPLWMEMQRKHVDGDRDFGLISWSCQTIQSLKIK